jgi:hypothetical protein
MAKAGTRKADESMVGFAHPTHSVEDVAEIGEKQL